MVTLGVVGLIHAAISAAQHRSYLRLTEQDFTVLPLDIIFQSVVCLLVTMYGIICVAGDFKEVRATVELESKSFETFGNRPSKSIGERLTRADCKHFASFIDPCLRGV
ncbi:hypothetical protein HPB48_018198 [Haemaphysalis longicornis]|uniref:Membrane magnesium transporter n=1 Tax=Haemaphysalis longicornis TaxID=44386 RepID=A0A9J6GXM5_HAELO|nr:hypothetical protein HPB48_018198 [Haemaphysalis longicornis]